ncbi:hypothetical protein BFJ68_g13099 [Fusarium oxysporum]|uniref:Carboxylic ester hydrolase n=1 Tax=Fusarium oxysporum TaxID=5507 RepID=A0A420Q4J1_FUSOX|nr:hypothetical protein BFJ68_g13099 [Fusarium oxysporum]
MTSTIGNATGCAASAFSTPTLLGAEFLSLEANLVTDYSFDVPKGWTYSQPALNVQNATFCNVTVSYTHPGLNDTIYVEAWLPNEDDYNGRLQSLGGSGWTAGRFVLQYGGMINAVANGYASVTTDAGVPGDLTDWLFVSPGNLNTNALQNLGQVSLNDEAIIAKQLIKSFYGKAPSYSYWNGCSQGGRQGLKLAQQYPSAYDGIIAAAPGINWAEFFMNTIWPLFYMESTQQFPRGCELDEITSLAIASCDELDGVKDGIISDVDACRQSFDPFKQIGKSFHCSGTNSKIKISHAAAAVANASWSGPRFSDGRFMYYGFEIGTALSEVAPTKCTGDTCVGTRQDFAFAYQAFVNRKADTAISPAGTLDYYNQISDFTGNVTSFYKYYRVPALKHCWGGNGGQPEALFSQLRAWVENGTSPEDSPVVIAGLGNSTQQQIICPWPQTARFDGSCSAKNSTTCWSCKE